MVPAARRAARPKPAPETTHCPPLRHLPIHPSRPIRPGDALQNPQDVIVNAAGERPGFFGELRVLFAYRRLIGELVMRDLRVRYKRSVLGFLWTMLAPLLTMLILRFVFSATFKSLVPNYVVYVMAGLLFWGFFAQSSTQAMNAFVGHIGLLKIVYMPRSIYAFAVVGSGAVHLVLAVIPLLAIMLVTGHRISPAILFLPVAMVLTALFAAGVGLLLSTLAAFFGDVVTMYQILLVAWFYATPIIYPAQIVPEDQRIFLTLNPVSWLHSLFLEPIYSGRIPPANTVLLATGLALAGFAIGWGTFIRYADRLIYEV